jgi:hypothetical protein
MKEHKGLEELATDVSVKSTMITVAHVKSHLPEILHTIAAAEHSKAAARRNVVARHARRRWTPEAICKYFRAYHELNLNVPVRNLAAIISTKLLNGGDNLTVETIRLHTQNLRKELKKEKR